MSYIPKVGDEMIGIGTNNCNMVYIIVSVVGDIVGWISYNKIEDRRKAYGKSPLYNHVSHFLRGDHIVPKEKFIPKKGDKCYYPLYDYSNDCKYSSFEWGGGMGINRQCAMLANGLLFKTEEEATEARDKMIKAIQ